jgi:ABC-type antimicrobial peptide transport system ATPase subunit
MEQEDDITYLNHLEKIIEDKIKNTKAEVDIALYNSSKKNFKRLFERFAHDEQKLLQINKDKKDYLIAHTGLIYDDPMIKFGSSEDIKRIHENEDDYIMKIQEINKRIFTLLGDDYIDPNFGVFKTRKD